jgi:hypothetical protein
MGSGWSADEEVNGHLRRFIHGGFDAYARRHFGLCTMKAVEK